MKYHKPAAVIPSKNARCPPCFTVANTIYLFALVKTDIITDKKNKKEFKLHIRSSSTCIHPMEWLP